MCRIDLNVSREFTAAMGDMAATTRELSPAPSSSEVWRALKRIRNSALMMRAGRLNQLLTFLTETTLKGDAQYLKETTVGVAVFGRAPDYDPKTDTIVRSQAWRLRTKLRDYYDTEGAQDPIIISIPKGQYAAQFTFRKHS